MKLEKYNPHEQSKISELFIKTFSDSEGHEEGKLIGQLTMDLLINTDANDLYCFIAKEDEKIIGSIIFTRMTFEMGINAFILAPVAIHTDFQGKGIGQELINFGLNYLSKDGVELAITYGDPKFYSKVGFDVVSDKTIPAPLKLTQPEGWMAQSLTGDKVELTVSHKNNLKAAFMLEPGHPQYDPNETRYELSTGQYQSFSLAIEGNQEIETDEFAITMIEPINGGALLEWKSIPGVRYQVEATSDLTTPNWTAAGGALDASSLQTPLTISGALGNSTGFYRVLEVMP